MEGRELFGGYARGWPPRGSLRRALSDPSLSPGQLA